MRAMLKRSGIDKMLRVELLVASDAGAARLRGSGQIIVNPPWTLDEDLKAMLRRPEQTLERARK